MIQEFSVSDRARLVSLENNLKLQNTHLGLKHCFEAGFQKLENHCLEDLLNYSRYIDLSTFKSRLIHRNWLTSKSLFPGKYIVPDHKSFELCSGCTASYCSSIQEDHQI